MEPHTHDYHELLCFIGGNPKNINDFGAEIEMCLGEEQEKHIINSTTIVSIPPGLIHCPLIVKKCDPERPVVFLGISITRKFEKNSWVRVHRQCPEKNNYM
jgi:hypothetical protein